MTATEKIRREISKCVDMLLVDYDQWDSTINFGGGHYETDGEALWLIKNHISYDKNTLHDLCQECGEPLPSIYYRALPSDMPRNMMISGVDYADRNVNCREIKFMNRNEIKKLAEQVSLF